MLGLVILFAGLLLLAGIAEVPYVGIALVMFLVIAPSALCGALLQHRKSVAKTSPELLGTTEPLPLVLARITTDDNLWNLVHVMRCERLPPGDGTVEFLSDLSHYAERTRRRARAMLREQFSSDWMAAVFRVAFGAMERWPYHLIVEIESLRGHSLPDPRDSPEDEAQLSADIKTWLQARETGGTSIGPASISSRTLDEIAFFIEENQRPDLRLTRL